eukprot:CAMPEP_0197037988 /NCGR_PEP_ID=MMETSP1384-20130603/15054_1 /TAXON_ID=29189 /ORGANISM="Ammonia sp." /LENGTH=370 /DNA_ID=CAMNT_0042468375 /DNA_START=16 /DNA_END=1128 /DNA_ORIENTATION=-
MAMQEDGQSFAGTLYKRGKFNRSFKERWFVVNRVTQMMQYYESEEKSHVKQNELGDIDLALIEKIQVMTTDANYDNDELPEFITYTFSSSEKKSFTFHLVSSSRTFTLAAVNEIDLQKWLQFLSICIYGGVIKEGYIKKQEGATSVSKAWRKRYAVLTSYYQLKFYQDQQRHGYLGFIDCTTLSSISNGKVIASELGYILDLYTKYGNVWYIGCADQQQRDDWNKRLTHLLQQRRTDTFVVYGDQDDKKEVNIFGHNMVFEDKCKSVKHCHSVERIVKCLHVFNGNLDEQQVNRVLSKNTYFIQDYHHLMSQHLQHRGEFQSIYKFMLSKIRHLDLQQSSTLTMPDEEEQNTFYINAMYVIHCYFFGNLV